MNFAKTGILSTGLLFLAISAAADGAVFTTTTTRTTCPTPTVVAGYVNNAVVCDTGNVDSWLEFNNFSSSASASDLAIQGLANAANQGFYFPVDMTGPANFQLGYDVTAVNTLIEGINLHVTANGNYFGQANVTMYVCVGQPAGCPTSQAKVLSLGSNSLLPYDTIYFDPTATIGVTFVGDVDAQALLAQFESTIITGTPEPASLSMLGAGLLALGIARSRRENQSI